MIKRFVIKVVGICMVILSVFSLFAYNCYFHDIFTQAPGGYMFFLFYYRSHHCDAGVNWSALGVVNVSSLNEPQMPDEITSVTRTFWIAVIQLIFNILLIIVSINMLGKVQLFFGYFYNIFINSVDKVLLAGQNTSMDLSAFLHSLLFGIPDNILHRYGHRLVL